MRTMNRKGADGVLLPLLLGLFVVVILAVIFTNIGKDINTRTTSLQGVQGCDVVGSGKGRCFSTDTCDDKAGWRKIISGIGCSKEQPVCCYLNDLDSYYEPGTALLEFHTPTLSFRFKKYDATATPSAASGAHSDLIPEAVTIEGKSAQDAQTAMDGYLSQTVGLPPAQPFTIKYRRENENEKWCKLTLRGDSKSEVAYAPVACAPGSDGFVSLSKVNGATSLQSSLDLRQKTNGLKCENPVGNTCEVTVEISASDAANGAYGTPKSYTILFAQKR